MQEEYKRFDLVIVGGGLVGASLAAIIARDKGLQIAVIELYPASAIDDENITHPSYDARTTAVANGSCHIFSQLGIWERMKQKATPIEGISITDRGRFGRATISAREENVSALGYVVENRWLGAVLNDHIQQLGNVCVYAPAELSTINHLDEGVELILAGDAAPSGPVYTPLLVVADGAESETRRKLGIGVSVSDYNQTAIVTNVTPEAPHNNLAWERFTDTGPLALLPITDNRLGVVWCQPPDDADTLLSMDDGDFLQALQQAAGNRSGRFGKPGKRFSYPLSLTTSDEQVRPHIVVLGNSAHGLHPVAGQGFNLSLRDAVVLTRVVYEAMAAGKNHGALSVLQGYLSLRERDQQRTISFSDKITKTFSTRNSAIALIRNSGLVLFDSWPGAKRFVSRYAMGRAVSTRLPQPSGRS
jgi:2-octaprenyl-6-methoxyphenol hydroxylase